MSTRLSTEAAERLDAWCADVLDRADESMTFAQLCAFRRDLPDTSSVRSTIVTLLAEVRESWESDARARRALRDLIAAIEGTAERTDEAVVQFDGAMRAARAVLSENPKESE